MNANVLNTAITILASHIQPGPAVAATAVPQTNQTNVLITSIAILQAHMNATVSASGMTIIQPTTVFENQQRRGHIDFSEKLAIADLTDPLKPPSETDILSVDIKPKYSVNPHDSPVRPTDYTITPTIAGTVDRSAEIIKLNKQIVDLTDQVKSTTATLSVP